MRPGSQRDIGPLPPGLLGEGAQQWGLRKKLRIGAPGPGPPPSVSAYRRAFSARGPQWDWGSSCSSRGLLIKRNLQQGLAELGLQSLGRQLAPLACPPSSGLTCKAHKVTKCISVLTASSRICIWDPATALSCSIQRWARTSRQNGPQSSSWERQPKLRGRSAEGAGGWKGEGLGPGVLRPRGGGGRSANWSPEGWCFSSLSFPHCPSPSRL